MLICLVRSAAAGVYANYAPSLPCGQAEAAQTTLPVFVGEFSLQAYYNNSLAIRQTMYSTQVYACGFLLSFRALPARGD